MSTSGDLIDTPDKDNKFDNIITGMKNGASSMIHKQNNNLLNGNRHLKAKYFEVIGLKEQVVLEVFFLTAGALSIMSSSLKVKL
jgi:hypothetical protein